jgi:hypothetical protein
VAPVADSAVEEPAQMVTSEPAFVVGISFTVTVTVAALLQLPVVPIAVYVVVTVGLAETLAPVVADKPVAGDHV